MKFFSAIGHGIEKVLGVVNKVVAVAAPIAAAIPGPLGLILQSIMAVEQIVVAPGQGAIKKQLVIDLVKAEFPTIDVAQLSGAIDTIVAGLNQLGVVHSSTSTAAAAQAAPAKT